MSTDNSTRSPGLSDQETSLLAELDRWWTHRHQEFVDDLVRWVAVPSVSDTSRATAGSPFGPDIDQMFAVVAARAATFGLETEFHDGYAISVSYGDDPQIGLVSHLDVVPAGDSWTLPPFDATVRGDFIIGRGASDNKGPALVDLYLLRFLKEAGVPLYHGVRVIYGGAEETSMDDMRHFAQTGPVPRVSLVTDGPFPVNNAQKGGLNLEIELPAGPRLRGFNAGTAHNSVPDEATLDLVGVEVEQVLAAAADVQPPGRVEVELFGGGIVLTARGAGGHAAFPETGTFNAVGVLARALIAAELVSDDDLRAARALDLLSDPYGRALGVAFSDTRSGRLTINVGTVRAQGEKLRVGVDIRYPVTDDASRILSAIEAGLGPLGGTVVDSEHRPPHFVSPDDRRVRLLQDTFTDVTGLSTEPIAMGGGTHARVLPGAITFGPGFKQVLADHPDEALTSGLRGHPWGIPAGHGNTHGPDEFVDLRQLRLAASVYLTAVRRLDVLW